MGLLGPAEDRPRLFSRAIRVRSWAEVVGATGALTVWPPVTYCTAEDLRELLGVDAQELPDEEAVIYCQAGSDWCDLRLGSWPPQDALGGRKIDIETVATWRASRLREAAAWAGVAAYTDATAEAGGGGSGEVLDPSLYSSVSGPDFSMSGRLTDSAGNPIGGGGGTVGGDPPPSSYSDRAISELNLSGLRRPWGWAVP